MSWPDASSAHADVATSAPTIATVELAPSIAARIAAMTKLGAITRSAVSVSGRGASVARRPAAHANHNKVAAAARGALAHESIAADAAGPADNGRVTQATRNNQSMGGRARTTPFARLGA